MQWITATFAQENNGSARTYVSRFFHSFSSKRSGYLQIPGVYNNQTFYLSTNDREFYVFNSGEPIKIDKKDLPTDLKISLRNAAMKSTSQNSRFLPNYQAA